MKKKSIIILSTFFATSLLTSCSDNQTQDSNNSTTPTEESIVYEKNEDLKITWGVTENYYQGKFQFKSILKLTNTGNIPLTRDNWNIYFSFCPGRKLIKLEKGTGLLKLDQIMGDFFKLSPDVEFKGLAQGESIELEIIGSDWAISEADAPKGFYMISKNSNGKEQQPITLSNYTILPFNNESQTKRFDGDNRAVPSAENVYEKFANTTKLEKNTFSPIIPSPVKFEMNDSEFIISSSTPIFYNSELKKEAEFLKSNLDQLLETQVVINEGNRTDVTKGISLKIGTVESYNEGDQAYSLTINNNDIQITGSDPAGVFYGIQSLRALIPNNAYAKQNDKISIQSAKITDAPRFDYRGLHLDVGRNFQEKEEILKLLDLMAFYKLNKFHFHFTDDEGWRIEIEGLPELTEVGSRRGHDLSETKNIMPSYGSGANPSFDASHGSGYYSIEDYLEILKYATERHIEVIPEIDVPGHARAAILSMKARYNRLMKEGKEKEAVKYLLNDPKDSSEYLSVQLYTDNVMCVCQNSTYNFIEKVISEIKNMHMKANAPLTTIHIGGDEVPGGVWEKAPSCQELIATNTTELSTQNFLTNTFLKKMNNILKKDKLVIGGWEEIGLFVVHKEGEPTKKMVNPEFAKKGFQPYTWDNVWGWGNEDMAYQLANAGYPVVLSNATNLYFDLAYEKDPKEPGFYWAGFVGAEQPFEFIPMDLFKSAKTDRMGNKIDPSIFNKSTRLTEEGQKNILGIQGQLWSETVKGAEMMEYFIFPKIIGLAERAWSKNPTWANIENDKARNNKYKIAWNQFSNSIGQNELPRLDYLNNGVNYRIPLVGAKVVDNKIKTLTKYPGFVIRYTTDGTTPNENSPIVDDNLNAKSGTKYIFAAFNKNNRSSRATTLSVE